MRFPEKRLESQITAVQELASHLRGALLRPSDADYEQARQLYNGMIDKHPTLIARCVDVADVIVGVDPANNERMIGWARDYWMALHPYSAGGGYINMMMDEGTDNVKAAYRDNYARLAQVKATYDPDNLFHMNQNIKPTR
jgi:Berberine and berberine like